MRRILISSALTLISAAAPGLTPVKCLAQSDRPSSNQSLPTNQLGTTATPVRTLSQSGASSLQSLAPVVVAPVIRQSVITAPGILSPVITHPIISVAASRIQRAPVITASVIDPAAPPSASLTEPAPAATPAPTPITPQTFGLLTLPMLPITSPGQSTPTVPTVLSDLTKQQPSAGTESGSARGFGPLALTDLSMPAAFASANITNKAESVQIVNGVLTLPFLSYVLLPSKTGPDVSPEAVPGAVSTSPTVPR